MCVYILYIYMTGFDQRSCPWWRVCAGTESGLVSVTHYVSHGNTQERDAFFPASSDPDNQEASNPCTAPPISSAEGLQENLAWLWSSERTDWNFTVINSQQRRVVISPRLNQDKNWPSTQKEECCHVQEEGGGCNRISGWVHPPANKSQLSVLLR